MSANPTIIMNKIKQNNENGIYSLAKNNVRCDGVIKFNEIERNKDNGINCCGFFNYTRIEKNQNIAHHKRAGIRVMEGA